MTIFFLSSSVFVIYQSIFSWSENFSLKNSTRVSFVTCQFSLAADKISCLILASEFNHNASQCSLFLCSIYLVFFGLMNMDVLFLAQVWEGFSYRCLSHSFCPLLLIFFFDSYKYYLFSQYLYILWACFTLFNSVSFWPLWQMILNVLTLLLCVFLLLGWVAVEVLC